MKYLRHKEYNAENQNVNYPSVDVTADKGAGLKSALQDLDCKGFAICLLNEEFCIADTDAVFTSQLQDEDCIVQSSEMLDYEW